MPKGVIFSGRLCTTATLTFHHPFQNLSHGGNFYTRDFTAATRAATAMGVRSFSCSVLENNVVDTDAMLTKGEENDT